MLHFLKSRPPALLSGFALTGFISKLDQRKLQMFDYKLRPVTCSVWCEREMLLNIVQMSFQTEVGGSCRKGINHSCVAALQLQARKVQLFWLQS